MTRRYSKKREQILQVLKKAGGAWSAAMIHKALPELDLTTIYRNLELFVSQGDLKRLNLKGKGVHYEYQAKPHHHAICLSCERVIHFDASDEKLKKLLKIKGFDVEEVEVTVRGTCTHKD